MPKNSSQSRSGDGDRAPVGSTEADLSPSEATGTFWIGATHVGAIRRGRTREPGLAGGKWMIFVPRERIDETWAVVRRALENGDLGPDAKVSTARPNPNSPDPSKHVIIVYTDDADAETDIREVREALRAIGITWKIPYKTDAATRAGKYQVHGDTRISKLYE